MNENSPKKLADPEVKIEDTKMIKKEEKCENLGYVSGDETTNYDDMKKVDPEIAHISKWNGPLVHPADSPKLQLEKKEGIALTTTITTTVEKGMTPVVVKPVEEVSLPKEKVITDVPQQQQHQETINQAPKEMGNISRRTSLENHPQAPQQHQHPNASIGSTLLSNLNPHLGLYTPDSATNHNPSIHSINTTESPISQPHVQQQEKQHQKLQQQQQQQHHSQASLLKKALSQQQSIKQPLFQNYSAAYGNQPQVPNPSSPSPPVIIQQQQQQMSAAHPSQGPNQNIVSTSPHCQQSNTSPHSQHSPLPSPYPMAFSHNTHNPYSANVSQPTADRQASQSPASHYVQQLHHQHQSTPDSQMQQFKQLQHNLWQNYNPVNVAAAMGMTQQAASHLNNQLAASNFQADQAARNAAASYAYQTQSGPTPTLHTPTAVNAASYYGGYPTPGAPSISGNHLMQQFGHHPMLNYSNGYGFMNQFVYHPTPAPDHQRSSEVAPPQPGTQESGPPHPLNMYPGYPHLGYPANYHN